MQTQVTLTSSQSKRLIAKGILAWEPVRHALKDGILAVGKGTTNSYIAEELLGGASFDRKAYVYGRTSPAGVSTSWATAGEADVVFSKGTLVKGITANDSVGEMAPIGLPAFTLLDTSELQVAISVDELDVGRLAVGQAAQVTLDAIPDATLDGTVKSIAPAATLAQGSVVYYDVVVALLPTDEPVPWIINTLAFIGYRPFLWWTAAAAAATATTVP